MLRWLSDGWTDSDWSHIENLSAVAFTLARDFDSAVGAGGGSLTPFELSQHAKLARQLAYQLDAIASRYC